MTGNFKERISSLVNELKVPKTQRNDFGNYYYRSLEDILQAVKPLLFKYGMILNITDDILFVGDRYYIKSTATLEDIESDQKVLSTGLARETTERKKYDESQLTGSASSYARKYALNGLFNIDDTKDSDFTNKGENQSAEPVQGKRLDQYGNSDLITEKQRKLLYARTKEKQLSEETVKLLLGNYGYESSKDIKRTDFNKILEDLDKAK